MVDWSLVDPLWPAVLPLWSVLGVDWLPDDPADPD